MMSSLSTTLRSRQTAPAPRPIDAGVRSGNPILEISELEHALVFFGLILIEALSHEDLRSEPAAACGLAARIESLFQLLEESRDTVLRVGPLELDLIERTARRGHRRIDLRPREFDLLKCMMSRKDQVLTRAMLLEEVWHYQIVPHTNRVDVHMGRLRRKVDEPCEPSMIRNIRGVGFVLQAPA
jgi:two-component system OmpR family response regulator